jgi:gliding motility-associated-like protein
VTYNIKFLKQIHHFFMKKLLLFFVFFSSLLSLVAQNNTDCAFLDAGPDDEVGCAGGACTEISAAVNFDLLGGGDDTSSYIVGPVNCPLDVQPGTPVSVNIDDTWSEVIDITFDFSFFGNTYNQLLIGSNGVLTFDLADAGGYCSWSFSEMAPDPNLITNAIFGAYHDIDPSVCGSIEYYITGTAPFRAFVVNFDQVCHFSCNSLKTTQHIILYESSNIIDVYIDDKPTCTGWNNGNALLGIQNESGTVAYTAPDRNTGPWTATDEQWRFVPDDDFTIDYEFVWLDDDDNVISNELSTWVCPTETTTYTAQLSYSLNGSDYVMEDQVTISVNGQATVEATQPEDLEVCAPNGVGTFDLTEVEPVVIGNQTDVTVTYYLTELDADNQTNPITDVLSYQVSENTVIWVRVSDDNSVCYALTNFELILLAEDDYPIYQPDNLEECSLEPGGDFAQFDLESQTETIAGGQTDVVITYYETEEDAIAGSNPITGLYTNLSNPQTIYARLTNNIGCYNTTTFDLIVNPGPIANQPGGLRVCNEGDGIGIFNLESQTDVVVNDQSDVVVTYYTSESDAQQGYGEISSVDLEAYTSQEGMIYLRVENTVTGCYSTTSFNLFIENCIPDVPNAFSPNGDGLNDIFSIDRLENVFYDYTFTVYNRWGQVVFEGDRSTGFWDGSVDGVISTDPTAATYFYVLDFNDGINEPVKGWIYVNP